ncbi:MAG: hypothetical protein JXR95_16085 [Deltaproteobacteria bacterium]|nr:hypothetical protein [Deltaproteobacteria bacterium]
MTRNLLTIITAVFLLSGCKSSFGSLEQKTDFTTEKKEQRKKRNISIGNIIKKLDLCKDGIYCKAQHQFDEYLSSVSREKRFEILFHMIKTSTLRVKTLAIIKIFPFAGNAELSDFLRAQLGKIKDPSCINLVAALLILSGIPQDLNLITKHWEQFGNETKKKLIWALRHENQRLPKEFIDRLSLSEIPEIRASSVEFQSTASGNISKLEQCIRNNNLQSPYCVAAYIRRKNPQIPTHFVQITKEMISSTKTSKKRLNAPKEMVMGLQSLVEQKRIKTQEAFDIIVDILGNRRLGDSIRSQAAYAIGELAMPHSRKTLERYRRDRRKRVGYAVRRAIYFLESKG